MLILKSNYLIHSLKNLQQLTHRTQQPLLRSPLRGSLHPAYAVSIPHNFLFYFFRIAILEKWSDESKYAESGLGILRLRKLNVPDWNFVKQKFDLTGWGERKIFFRNDNCRKMVLVFFLLFLRFSFFLIFKTKKSENKIGGRKNTHRNFWNSFFRFSFLKTGFLIFESLRLGKRVFMKQKFFRWVRNSEIEFSRSVNAEKWFPFSSANFPLLFLLIFLFLKNSEKKIGG